MPQSDGWAVSASWHHMKRRDMAPQAWGSGRTAPVFFISIHLSFFSQKLIDHRHSGTRNQQGTNSLFASLWTSAYALKPCQLFSEAKHSLYFNTLLAYWATWAGVKRCPCSQQGVWTFKGPFQPNSFSDSTDKPPKHLHRTQEGRL